MPYQLQLSPHLGVLYTGVEGQRAGMVSSGKVSCIVMHVEYLLLRVMCVLMHVHVFVGVHTCMDICTCTCSSAHSCGCVADGGDAMAAF